ncbi:MAG: Pseudopilin GspJ [Planctomycetaceae bacterium]|nr:Pseudopilin GspJ [Planctomycetaceae bacterium]
MNRLNIRPLPEHQSDLGNRCDTARKPMRPSAAGVVPPRGAQRNGLSLVEVLISLALSMLLLSSVYTAIDLYFRQSHAGQEEIEHNQLARALLQRIELDLRSISYRETTAAATDADSDANGKTTGSGTAPAASGTAGGQSAAAGSGTTGTDTTTTTTTTVKSPSDAFSGSDSGLFGDAQTLVLHVSRPNKELGSLQQMNAQMMGNRTSDLKTVAFFVAGVGSGGLQSMAAAQFATQSSSGTISTRGLARMEGERLALQLADKNGSVGSMLGRTQMLAPEVSRMMFRYYDGSIWQTQWDSVSYGGLPRAVEVTLELTFAAKSTGQGRYKKTHQEAPRIFRTVVPLPISKPILQTSS